MRCPVRNSRSRGYGPQRLVLLKVWLEDSKTIKRQLPAPSGSGANSSGILEQYAK